MFPILKNVFSACKQVQTKYRNTNFTVMQYASNSSDPSCGRAKLKTINLADQLCKKSQPTKLVVSKDGFKDPCVQTTTPGYKRPKVMPVYICKPREMKRICPPQPCKCLPKMPPKTLQQKVLSGLWLATKIGIAGGVLYVTVDNGVWQGSEQTSCLYNKIYNHVLLFFNKEIIDEPEVPKLNEISHRLKETWNKGVILVCSYLINAPTMLVIMLRAPAPQEEPKKKVAKNEFGCTR
ncbi:uncharacterized protein [Periplaneta americana]|uniref:uncharacterized protein n=1 Tax=Periplaneta americana TaxID=6978 RepID=UPI0037E961A5